MSAFCRRCSTDKTHVTRAEAELRRIAHLLARRPESMRYRIQLADAKDQLARAQERATSHHDCPGATQSRSG